MIYTLSLRDFLTQVYPSASIDTLNAYKSEKMALLHKLNPDDTLLDEVFLYVTSSASEINVILEEGDEKQEVVVSTLEDERLPPRVIKAFIENLIDLVDVAIHAKQEKYDREPLQELQTILEDCYSYGRYMERCETDFIWGDDKVPSGLSESMNKNEADIRALEFEIGRREFLKQND